MLLFKYRGDDMSRRSNQNNQYNGNQYNGNQYYGNNNQYYNQNGQYYNQNGQYYNQNGQYQNYNQNGQYYGRNNQMPQKQPKSNKFGILGPQNTTTPKKSDKPKDNSLLIKIGIFAAFAIILLIIVFSINSCGKKEPACGEDYRQIGTEKYGYYCIPSDWVRFEDPNLQRGIQYSDINGEYILTLDSVITTEISAQDYALAIANDLQKAGIVVQGAEVELDKYHAYQVYGQTDSGVWVLVYFFEGDDGYSHYVGVEGPDKTNEAFKIVESFTTEKEE